MLLFLIYNFQALCSFPSTLKLVPITGTLVAKTTSESLAMRSSWAFCGPWSTVNHFLLPYFFPRIGQKMHFEFHCNKILQHVEDILNAAEFRSCFHLLHYTFQLYMKNCQKNIEQCCCRATLPSGSKLALLC